MFTNNDNREHITEQQILYISPHVTLIYTPLLWTFLITWVCYGSDVYGPLTYI